MVSKRSTGIIFPGKGRAGDYAIHNSRGCRIVNNRVGKRALKSPSISASVGTVEYHLSSVPTRVP